VGQSAQTLEDALLARALHGPDPVLACVCCDTDRIPPGVRVRIIVWRPAPQLPTLLCPIASAVASFVRRCRRLSLPTRVLAATNVVPTAATLAPLDDPAAVVVVLVSGPGGVLSAHHEKVVVVDPDCPAHCVALTGVRRSHSLVRTRTR
jgi:hypothetical protein